MTIYDYIIYKYDYFWQLDIPRYVMILFLHKWGKECSIILMVVTLLLCVQKCRPLSLGGNMLS